MCGNTRHKRGVCETSAVVRQKLHKAECPALSRRERLRNKTSSKKRDEPGVDNEKHKDRVPGKPHNECAAHNGSECRRHGEKHGNQSIHAGRTEPGPAVTDNGLRHHLTGSGGQTLDKAPKVKDFDGGRKSCSEACHHKKQHPGDDHGLAAEAVGNRPHKKAGHGIGCKVDGERELHGDEGNSHVGGNCVKPGDVGVYGKRPET